MAVRPQTTISEAHLRELIQEAIRKAYEILGVSPDASQDQIKKAYITKIRDLHPDKNPGKDTTPETVKLNVAFGLLSDPEKRRKYDVVGDKTLGDFGNGFGVPSSSPGGSRYPNADDFRKAWSNATSGNTRREPPPPPAPKPGQWNDPPPGTWRPTGSPKPAPTPKAAPGSWNSPSGFVSFNKQYFEYVEGTSKKFWWAQKLRDQKTIRVGWGRIGTSGQVHEYPHRGEHEADAFMRAKMREKLDKGYIRTEEPVSKRPEQAPPPRTTPNTPPAASPGAPAPKASGGTVAAEWRASTLVTRVRSIAQLTTHPIFSMGPRRQFTQILTAP